MACIGLGLDRLKMKITETQLRKIIKEAIIAEMMDVHWYQDDSGKHPHGWYLTIDGEEVGRNDAYDMINNARSEGNDELATAIESAVEDAEESEEHY